jgi:hypothetical protein
MALEESAWICLQRCFFIGCMVVTMLITVPLIGYYGHLMASGYTEFQKTDCEFLGVQPLTDTCANSTVLWTCAGNWLDGAQVEFPSGIGNLTYPYTYQYYVYHGPNVTVATAQSCSQLCCDEFNMSVHYDCTAGAQDKATNQLNSLKCVPPSLPRYVSELCYLSIGILGVAVLLGGCSILMCVLEKHHGTN